MGNFKVYVYHTPDDMFYVGVTSMEFKNRIRGSYKTTSLQPYIKKYGFKNFEKTVVADGLEKYEAYRKEDELISYYTSIGKSINKKRSGLVESDEEYVKQRDCKWHKEHYEEYRDRKTEYNKVYYDNNKEKWKDYYHCNKEKINNKRKEWYEKNKDRINAERRRKAALKRAV